MFHFLGLDKHSFRHNLGLKRANMSFDYQQRFINSTHLQRNYCCTTTPYLILRTTYCQVFYMLCIVYVYVPVCLYVVVYATVYVYVYVNVCGVWWHGDVRPLNLACVTKAITIILTRPLLVYTRCCPVVRNSGHSQCGTAYQVYNKTQSET